VEFGSLVAVRDVSFELAGGDLVGLIGPNGAGKTTLLRARVGLQAPTAGSAEIFGRDVFNDTDLIRGKVGFAPDSPPAYEELTIEQFLMFIADANRIAGIEAEDRIDYWLEQVWLQEKRQERIKNLSRGMRQRVAIASSFASTSAEATADGKATPDKHAPGSDDHGRSFANPGVTRRFRPGL